MASDTIQKRRPKQNIISTILAKGYSSVSSAGSSFRGSSGKGGDSTTKRGRELVIKKTKSKEGSSGSSTTANSTTTSTSNQQTRDILKSAVELTRRSQMKFTSNTIRRVRSQSRSARKKHILTKGERAFYRSDKGIVKVTIVGVHHDSKLVPYYTIQLRDGKEKQTDGKHLSPVVPSAPKDSVHAAGTDAKKKDGDDAQTSSIRSRSAPPSEIDSPDLGAALTVSDHDMTESRCSEGAGKTVKLVDSLETKNDDGEGGNPDMSSPQIDNIASQEVENNGETLQKKFLIGGVAYYRPGDMSSVIKVRIVKHAKSKGLYTISLPDKSHQDNVKSTHLATLTELSSNEMIALMKESGSKSRDTTKVSSTKNKSRRRSSSTTENTPDNNDEEVDVDAGYEAGEGEPMSSGSEDSKSLSQQQFNSSHTVPVSIPTTALVQPPKMRMVQAKTESGEWKSVPYYEKGMSLNYMNAEGVQKCKVLSVDLDDLMEPYYTVLLDKVKREKQTDNAHLALSSEEEMLEALQDQAEKICNSVDKEEEQGFEGNQEKEEKDSSKSPPTRSSSKSPRSSSETNQRSSSETHPLSPSKNRPEENLASSDDKATQEEEEEARACIPATFFKDDQVLYKNSEGERSRAVVLSLKRDKKNRPYYVVRILHSGLDKLVYGHRLRPLPENRSSSRIRSRGRSVSSKEGQSNLESSIRRRSSSKGASTRRRSPSGEKPRQLEKALNLIRKQGHDSRGGGRGEESRSSIRHNRRSSLDSMDSNPSKRSESRNSVRSTLSNSSRRSQQVGERKDNHTRTRDNSVDSRRHNTDLDTSRGRKISPPNDPVGTSRKSRSTGERDLSRSSRAPSADSCRARERNLSRNSRAPSADSRVSTHTSSTVDTKLSRSSCRRATTASKNTNVDDSIREGSVRGSNDNLSQVSSSVTAISKLKSFRRSFGLKKSSK